jgi:hypothetical protein
MTAVDVASSAEVADAGLAIDSLVTPGFNRAGMILCIEYRF